MIVVATALCRRADSNDREAPRYSEAVTGTCVSVASRFAGDTPAATELDQSLFNKINPSHKSGGHDAVPPCR